MSKADQQALSKYFPKRGILYQPGFGIVFGSVNAGVMLSQLLFWHGSGIKKPWTYKTTEDMRQETGLTRTQQETAIRILVSHSVLEVKRKGVPATRHFKIDILKLHQILPSLKKTNKLNYPNPANYYVENDGTITKSTNKTTTKTSPVINKDNFFEKKQKLIQSKTGRVP